MNTHINNFSIADTNICVGRSENGELQFVDMTNVANPHMLFNGKSGSGKSFRIRHTIDSLMGMGITQHVLEFHPDFEYEYFEKDGAVNNVRPDSFEFFDFQYSTGNASINPLKMLDTSPESGGVYITAQFVVEAVKIWKPSLGDVQAGYLERIITDVFSKNGIYAEDYTTWVRAREFSPDLRDVQKHIQAIIRAKRTGLQHSIFTQIEKLRKQAKRQAEHIEKGDFDNNQLESGTADLEELKNQLKDKANEMIDRLVDGKDSGDYYSEWDLKSLTTLSNVIDNMVDSGLFTRKAITPKMRKINVYRISNLHKTHQKVMTFLLLTRLYQTSKLTCKTLNPRIPTTYITADEGRYVQDAAKNPDSPMNEIFGGARKFGLGMLVGVQGPHQLSKDMSDNFATKFVLYSDESAYQDAKRFFNLSATQMRALKPKCNSWFFNGSRPILVNS